MSGDLSQAKFISPVRHFCEKNKSFMVIQSKKRQNLKSQKIVYV